MGTAFTYQGRLTSSGTVANGTYDFEFRLYDDPLAGNLVAGPITVPAVVVTTGLFTAPLDFGSTPFAGKVRWLAIAVKTSGTPDPFTPLDRRQVLSPTPYAVFSSFTDPANLTNLDASHLTSGVLPSAQLSGSYTSALSLTSPSNVFAGDGSGLTNLNPNALYRRTVLVSPVGSPAANGAALLAALAGISSPSPTNPWLLKLEPGVYNVGAAGSLVMRPFVDIEGSGESVTKITSPGSASNIVGTVQTAINTELRHVTVENTGGAAFARPLYVTSGSPRISHVTVLGSGGTVETHGYYADGSSTAIVTDLVAQVIAPPGAGSFGILNVGASSVMSNVQSYALGGSFSQAAWNCCGAAPTIRNLFASASGATTENRGMTNTDPSTTPTLENVVALATGGANNNYGILNLNGTAPLMRLVSCRAIGASGNNYGCSNETGTHPTMMDVFAEGAGGATAEGVHVASAAAGLSLTRVRALASGASSLNRGVFVGAASPSITQLEALAFGAGTSEAAGVSMSSSSSSLTLATAAGSSTGTGSAIGVRVIGSAAAPALSHVVATGTGGVTAVGVWSGASTVPTMTNVTASAANGSSSSAGLFNQASSIVGLTDSTVTSAGPAASYGIWNQGATLVTLSGARVVASGSGTTYGMLNNASPGTVKVERSTLSGATGSIQNAVASTVNVAGSQLSGGVNATGTYTCVFSYNGAFAALNATCN